MLSNKSLIILETKHKSCPLKTKTSSRFLHDAVKNEEASREQYFVSDIAERPVAFQRPRIIHQMSLVEWSVFRFLQETPGWKMDPKTGHSN